MNKYQVVAFDENDQEIATFVYDGTPEKIFAKVQAELAGHGITAKRLEARPLSNTGAIVR